MSDIKLSGNTICVVGRKGRQNELMSSFIERVTGASCLAGENDYHIPKINTSGGMNNTRLILWDCQGNGEECLQEFESNYNNDSPHDLVAFINVRSDLGIEEDAIEQGIRGFFYESEPLELLPRCIKAIFQGELWVPRQLMSDYILRKRTFSSGYSKHVRTQLSEREIEILSLVTIGATNKEIAERLHISPHTVKSHIYNIFKKIDVPNRLQAVLWAGKNL